MQEEKKKLLKEDKQDEKEKSEKEEQKKEGEESREENENKEDRGKGEEKPEEDKEEKIKEEEIGSWYNYRITHRMVGKYSNWREYFMEEHNLKEDDKVVISNEQRAV